MCIVTGAECAMNLFGIADMQLTRGKVVVDPLHHRKHILTEGHTLIPPSEGGLSMLHLRGQNFGSTSLAACSSSVVLTFIKLFCTPSLSISINSQNYTWNMLSEPSCCCFSSVQHISGCLCSCGGTSPDVVQDLL